MQSAPCSAGSTACTERRPSSSTTTSSPGATSRSKSAPTRSSAHVSDATTHSPSSRPSDERPEAERVAEREQRRPPRARRPSTRPRAAPSRRRRRPSSGAESFAISAAISSLSDVEESFTPSSASCARSADAFVRLPLWPSATVRARAVVEERLRVRPLRRARRRVARVPDRGVAVQAAELLLVEDLRDEAHVAQHRQPAASETAMPADSWPRCCSAKRPKYVMRATSRCGRADAEHAAHG